MFGKMVMCVVIAALGWMCQSCGNLSNDYDEPPAQSDPEYDKIAPLVARNCGGCHNGSNQKAFTAARFKSSAARARLKNGSMPPAPATISQDDKALLLAYLK